MPPRITDEKGHSKPHPGFCHQGFGWNARLPDPSANTDRPDVGDADGCMRLWINGFDAHKPHQPLTPFAIDLVAQPPEMDFHRSAAKCRRFQILLVNQTYQLKIFRSYGFAFVICR